MPGPFIWDGDNARMLPTGDILDSDGNPIIGGSTDSFKTIQPISGTSPSADSSTDTLTMTSSDGSIGCAGNSGTDTLDWTVAGVGGQTAANVATATSLVNTAQSGYKFLASPSNGGSGAPSFRTLVLGDLPTAIPNANLATMAAGTVKANITGGSATPTDATYAQLLTAMNVFTEPQNMGVQLALMVTMPIL